MGCRVRLRERYCCVVGESHGNIMSLYARAATTPTWRLLVAPHKQNHAPTQTLPDRFHGTVCTWFRFVNVFLNRQKMFRFRCGFETPPPVLLAGERRMNRLFFFRPARRDRSLRCGPPRTDASEFPCRTLRTLREALLRGKGRNRGRLPKKSDSETMSPRDKK